MTTKGKGIDLLLETRDACCDAQILIFGGQPGCVVHIFCRRRELAKS